MEKIIAIYLLSMLHLTLADYSYSQQPEYQVSIVLKMPGNYGDSIHLCNGAIIYEKLILTTADCLHFKFGPNVQPNKLDASVISVIAGSTNGQTHALQMKVSSIEIARNFDPITLENDIALLTLSQPLPLGTRPDIRWIMLDDNSHMNRSCLVNFFSRNTKDAIPDYYQTEELNMINNEICRNSTKYPANRKRDICSLYILPHRFNCEKANSFLSLNNDRGTGIVCKSFLVGLLSSVVTRPKPANNCSDVVLKAIYTYINPHLRWIYSIMATMETEYISSPYDASLNPLVLNPSPDFSNSDNSTSTSNLTVLSNSTVASFPYTNLTSLNSLSSNSTIVNSTLTNFTSVNSTDVLNFATPNPLLINSTIWNTTSTSISARNHTTKPVTYNLGASAAPVPGSSTDPHAKHPNPKPPVQNLFKNNGVFAGLSTGSLLITLLYLFLPAIYL